MERLRRSLSNGAGNPLHKLAQSYYPDVVAQLPGAERSEQGIGRRSKRQRERHGENDAKTHHGDGYGIIGGELEHDEPPRPNLLMVPSPDPLR
jgi:hypothetical protein